MKTLRILGIGSPEFLKPTILEKNWRRDDELSFNFAKTFKDYIYDQDKISKFKQNLDPNSAKLVDKLINNIDISLQYNMIKYEQIFDKDEIQLQKTLDKKYYDFLKKYDIKFPYNLYEPSLFTLQEGICNIPHLQNKIKSKDILDCGAFIGDTAVIFSKLLDFDKIYCFEPNPNNFDNLQRTIKLNNFQEKIIPIKMGVGDKNETLNLGEDGPASSLIINNQEGKNQIQITTIDDFVEKNNINPGMIKRDIEGFELESVLGAQNTIKKFGPIMSISIYHTGKDFFDIKPLIESRDLGYKFRVEKYNPWHPRFESMLICYTD